MRSIAISAHNPMTGGRHLGHLLSTMHDWPRMQREHELYIIIDDLIAQLLYPAARARIEERTMLCCKEFAASGIDLDQARIILTSMIPEAHELAFFTGMMLDGCWIEKLYRESFPSLITAHQRMELGLPRSPSLSEMAYPQLHLASLTLGLRADFFQGGEEMRGYMPLLAALAEGFPASMRMRAPAFLGGRSMFVRGTDGRHMGDDNAIYLSESEDTILDKCRRTETEIIASWLDAMDGDEGKSAGGGEDLSRRLISMLKPYRASTLRSTELIDILCRGALDARERLRGTLIELKSDMHVTGYAAAC